MADLVRCFKCAEEKPRTDFQRCKSRKNGLQSACKACTKAYNAAYYAANRERVLTRTAEYAKAKPEVRRTCVERYRERHPDRVRASEARFREANADKLRAAARAYHARDPDLRRARFQEWYRTNHDLALSIAKRYREQHPAKMRANEAIRRRRIARSKIQLTDAEWRDTVVAFDSRCAYCCRPLDKPTMDHMHPIARGGAHSQDNVVPACLPCNLRKGTRGVVQMVNVPFAGA